jgi:hypothetical protein
MTRQTGTRTDLTHHVYVPLDSYLMALRGSPIKANQRQSQGWSMKSSCFSQAISAVLHRVQLHYSLQPSQVSALRSERVGDECGKIHQLVSDIVSYLHLCPAVLTIGDDRDTWVQLNVKIASVINS